MTFFLVTNAVALALESPVVARLQITLCVCVFVCVEQLYIRIR